ncbi:MAG: RdgB/HAM1 family non-canonical purine NTP pyrophosphatase [Gemmatimonadaceae bacterium]
MKLLLATRSLGKLAELRPLLAPLGYDVVDLEEAGIAESPAEEELERFETFEENALAKARYFHALSGGVPVLSDDSGLVVDALSGEPGVRSKRWSGRSDLSGRSLDAANNAMLLRRLDRVTDRSARYVCVAAFVGSRGEVVRRGETEGRILSAPRGEEGFGYDPLFESAELGRTFGELTREEKARISHRGRAVRALIAELSRGH